MGEMGKRGRVYSSDRRCMQGRLDIVRLNSLALVVMVGFLSSVACKRGPRSAGEITDELAAEILLDGATAHGSVGDYFLRNNRIIAIVEAPGRVFGPSPYGGNIIDLGLAEARKDVLGETMPFLQLGLTANFEEIEIIESGALGERAVLEARGSDAVWDFLNIESLMPELLGYQEDERGKPTSLIKYDPDRDLPLEIRARYTLEPDSDAIEVRYHIKNVGDSPLALHVGFGADLRGQVEAFTKGRGFGDPGLDLDDASNLLTAQIDTPFIAFQAEGFSMGIKSLDYLDDKKLDRLTLGVVGVAVVLLGSSNILGLFEEGDFEIEPGQQRAYGFDLYMGGDVSDVRYWAEGQDDWGFVQGKVVMGANKESVQGARIVAYQPDTGEIENSFESDASGAFDGRLPAGTYHFAADHLSYAPNEVQVVEVTEQGTVNLDFQLQANARVEIDVQGYNDVGSASQVESIPCRVMLLGPKPDRSAGLCSVLSACDSASPFRHDKRWEHDDSIFRYARNLQHCDTSIAPDKDLEVAPGKYTVVVTRGPEFDYVEQWVDLGAGDTAQITGDLHRVVERTGWAAADFHVHQVASTDSIVSNEQRVRGYAAEAIDLFVTTDHDAVSDLRPLVTSMGLDHMVQTLPGCEVSTSDLGHFNAFPIEPIPGKQFGQPPDWGGGAIRPTPGELFAQIRQRGAAIVQINHPRMRSSYFNALHLNYDFSAGTISEDGQEAPSPKVLRMGEGSVLWSADFDTLEIYNGIRGSDAELVMRDWFNMLSMGYIRTGTGTSDSHSAFSSTPGEPRTLVPIKAEQAHRLDPELFTQELKQGRAVITTGPMLEVHITHNDQSIGVGETLSAPKDDLILTLKANTPRYYTLEKAEIFINQQFSDPSSLANSKDPIPPLVPDHEISLVANPIVRSHGGEAYDYHAEIPLSSILPATGDAWVVVRVRGASTSQFPVSLTRANVTFNSSAKTQAEFMTVSGGLQPLALTNALYLDLNQNGSYDPPASTN
jgi:hypothetical protein